MGKNDDKFSFDKDPGKLKETSNDLDFTFSDIPVLGVKKETKDAFSFDDAMDEQAPLVSFEPKAQSTNFQNLDENQEQETPFNKQKTKKSTAKKKKLILIIVVANIILIAGVIAYLMYFPSEKLQNISIKKNTKSLSEKEKKELEAKKRKEKVNKIIASAENKYNTKKYKKAIEVYQEAIALDPKNPKALTGLGFCFKQLKDFKKSEKAFSKAIGGDAPLDAFIELSTIYENQNKFEEKYKVLEKAIKKFPKKAFLSLDLAETYKNAGEIEKALALYKTIPKKEMNQESLMAYAELTAGTSKSKSIQIYIYIGNKYLNFMAFKKASQQTNSPSEKINIFDQAVKTFTSAPSDIKVSYLETAKFYKLEALINNKNNEEAAKMFSDFDYLRLDKQYLEQIIDLAIASDYKKQKELVLKFLKLFPNDFDMHIRIQNKLISTQKSSFLLNIYSDYWTQDPNSPLANFLRGKAIRTNPQLAKKYYQKAIRLKSDFSQARIELGKIYINEKKWKEAENLFEFSINIDKKNHELHFYYALASFKNGKGPIAIKEYADFLNNLNLSPQVIALKLLPLAFLLPTPEKTDALLHTLEQNPKYLKQYKILKAKRYLIFPEKNTDAFNVKNPRGQLREYCILNLLRQGKIRQVLMMQTPKDEFPEFWKIFIARRKNMKTWRPMAKKFLEKHKNDTKLTQKVIMKLWLGELTPQIIENKLSTIPYAQKPLMLFILAEEYKNLNNTPKSKIRYRKALACGRNIYTDVIKYFMKH